MRRSLPIDVIEDILSKLPVKHLLRCKLVCKSYYAMITSPGFIARHHQSSSTSTQIMVVVHRPGVYLGGERRPAVDIIVPFLSPVPANDKDRESQVYVPPGPTIEDRSFRIVGSCNGLLCADDDDYKDYTVWNPATREYIHLPPPNKFYNMRIGGNFLALGFGHDAKANDYKLVKIENKTTSRLSTFMVEFWSMNTNCWQVLSADLLVSGKVYAFYHQEGLFLKGSLYWLAIARKENSDRSDPIVLVSLDMSDNTFRIVTLPPDVGADNKRVIPIINLMGVISFPKGTIAIVDFMGSLSLIEGFSRSSSSGSPRQRFFHVWVMDDNNNWTRRFSSIGPFKLDVQPTSVCVNNGDLLMKYKNDRYNFELIFYDPCNNKEQKKMEFPFNDDIHGRFVIWPWNFTESVVPIKNAKRR